MTQASATSSAFSLSHKSRTQVPLSRPARYGNVKFKCAVRSPQFPSPTNTVTCKVLRAIRSTHPSRRLTLRLTGPIAACRHLGYKSLAQIPAHRNGPVNSNVSHHRKGAGEEFDSVETAGLRKVMAASEANSKYKMERLLHDQRDRRTGKPVAGWRFAPASYAVMPVSKPIRNVAGINLLPQNQFSRLTEGETQFGRYITQRQQSTRLLFWLQQ